jgi:hypothetical protein
MRLGVCVACVGSKGEYLLSGFDFLASSLNSQFSVQLYAFFLILVRSLFVAARCTAVIPRKNLFENPIVSAVSSDGALLRALERRDQCFRIPC